MVKNILLKLEKHFKEWKEKEMKIKNKITELRKLEEVLRRSKIPNCYYTPNLLNYYEWYKGGKKLRKPKNKLMLKTIQILNDQMIKISIKTYKNTANKGIRIRRRLLLWAEGNWISI